MGEGGLNKVMVGRTTRVDVVRRWLRNPLLRFLLSKVIIPCDFMSFSKVIEVGIVFRYLGPVSGEKILDVGCGLGEQSARLAGKTAEVHGVDLDERAIQVAATLYADRATFVVADAGRLPFASEYFDKVVSVCALEHFASDEEAIEEMGRVLRSGGILVLTVDSFSSPAPNEGLRDRHRTAQQVVNYYRFPGLAQKLEKHGFEVERSQYFIRAVLSSFFFELQIRNYWISAAVFPIAYALALISDHLADQGSGGYLLALRARKRPHVFEAAGTHGL
jgi:ubiquinone/menaquinone biosynthesis C-methylase UbiE